jgi:tight adherence protein B
MSALYLVYGGAAIFGILLAEALYLLYAGRNEKRAAVNRRMKLQEGRLTQQQVLMQLRKERGVSGAGPLSLDGLRRLRTQSGLVTPLPRFLATTSGCAFGAGIMAWWFGMPAIVALMVVLVAAALLPVMALRFLRKRRVKMFGMQLPEALELITRSLKAGHPVPVAIAMVAREMADPIGSEFGMVSDEVTYGSDLVSALNSLFERVGQEDLPLFVTAVSIQSSSGGNLREILDGLSAVIRERGKLRRKVRAISTEGRMSAYILTAVPVLFMIGVNVIMPEYYESIIGEALTWYLLGASVMWLVLGNAIMFKMANFRF